MKSNWIPVILSLILLIAIIAKMITSGREDKKTENSFSGFVESEPVDTVWTTPWNKYQIPMDTDSGKLIWYGLQLISNTSLYLGPKGTVAQITNGMNCQNCHLSAGTTPYGFNFGKVYATYPQYKDRDNKIVTIYDRINNCLERSLNGQAMDSDKREMRAMYSYMKWLGQDVPKDFVPEGTSVMKLKYLTRAADPKAGRNIFIAECQSCHGNNGQGVLNQDGTGYIYPPLWGGHSYDDGAGMYRITNFAGFVKNNMPFGTTYKDTRLTDEEAWDVAAYVNSQPRPHKDQQMDWKNLKKKPIDFPFGPYSDTFSQKQHKYGPFGPIKNSKQLKTST